MTGHSPSLDNGQKGMWVVLVDVLMIDVGCTSHGHTPGILSEAALTTISWWLWFRRLVNNMR